MSLLWLAKEDYILDCEVIHATVKNPNWMLIGYNNSYDCYYDYLDWVNSFVQVSHLTHFNGLYRQEVFI